MTVDVAASQHADTQRDHLSLPCTGFASDAFPEVQESTALKDSHTGVSTHNVHSERTVIKKRITNKTIPHWYVLRTTYGREKKAFEYLTAHGVKAFYPTITTTKMINGKRRTVEESRLPNIFFAFGTEEELQRFVYDNVNLPYLRFYYRYSHVGSQTEKHPLIIPDYQMKTFRIICKAEAADTVVSADSVTKFETGQLVRVIDGKFQGVIGRVARYQGQQRVGIVIDGWLTVATAYVPNGFLEKYEEGK